RRRRRAVQAMARTARSRRGPTSCWDCSGRATGVKPGCQDVVRGRLLGARLARVAEQPAAGMGRGSIGELLALRPAATDLANQVAPQGGNEPGEDPLAL